MATVDESISGTIAFEPVLTGIRVTARDQDDELLWGFVACKDTIDQTHRPVGIYDRLRSEMSRSLSAHGKLDKAPDKTGIEEARAVLDRVMGLLKKQQTRYAARNISAENRDQKTESAKSLVPLLRNIETMLKEL